jgi:hypothetical protein
MGLSLESHARLYHLQRPLSVIRDLTEPAAGLAMSALLPKAPAQRIPPSRCALASELCHASPYVSSPDEGRRSAEKRRLYEPHQRVRRAPRCQMSPPDRASGARAFRRSTADSLRRINASAQLQPRFLGFGVIGCHPHLPLSQSSELLAGRSLLPAGRCPEPPGSGVTSPARGHRTRFRHSAVTGDALRRSKLAAR